MDLFTEPPPLTEPAKVDQTIFLRVVWSGVILSSVFLIIRLYARWNSFKKLFIDDALVIFAWLLALLTAIDWQVVARLMFQFMDITSGRLWPPPPTFVIDTERYYKGSAVVLVFFYTGLWAIKFSFLVFFKRLGQNVARQGILWWTVFTITVASYLVCIGDIEYSCLTAPLEKIELHCSTKSAIHYQRVTLEFNCAVDVLTDWMIMAIPITLLWGVQMSIRKKAALIGLFSLAIITSVFAIARVLVISSLTRQPDTSWAYMWSSIEQCIAIIVACLASFRNLFSQQSSRPTGPKYSVQNASKNIFLRGYRRTHRGDASMDFTELTEQSSQQRTFNHDANSDLAFEATNEGANKYTTPPKAMNMEENV